MQSQLDKTGHADDTNHFESIEDEIFLGFRLLARLEKAEEVRGNAASQSTAAHNDLRSSLTVKIPTFSGDVMQWPEFWELFCISVHDNPSYANIQKFVVLKSQLSGIAKQAIEGISVSGDGYVTAVEIVRNRFDQPNVRRDNLVKQMVNLRPVCDENDIRSMRCFADILVANYRMLSILGVSSDSFTSMLLPVIIEKVPESWRIEWARQGKGDFDSFVEFLLREVQIREFTKSDKIQHQGKTSSYPPSVTDTQDLRHHRAIAEINDTSRQESWNCKARGIENHGLQVVKGAGMRYQSPRSYHQSSTDPGRHHADVITEQPP